MLKNKDKDNLRKKDVVQASGKGLSLLLDPRFKLDSSAQILDSLYHSFTHNFMRKLYPIVGRDSRMHVVGRDLVLFNKYVDGIAEDSLFFLFRFANLGDYGFFSVDTAYVAHLVEVAFGAKRLEEPARKESAARVVTNLELEALGVINEALFQGLGVTLSMHSDEPIPMHIVKTEIGARFLSEIRLSEKFYMLGMDLICSGRKIRIDLGLPYSILSLVKSISSSESNQRARLEDERWMADIEGKLRGVNVEVQLTLNGAVSKVGELLNLKVGNTVVLDKFSDDLFEVRLNGVKSCLGKLGKVGDKVAVCLTEDIDIGKFGNSV